MKATVYWMSSVTGASGHGKPLALKDAEAWVKKGNKEWPDLTHWLVAFEGS